MVDPEIVPIIDLVTSDLQDLSDYELRGRIADSRRTGIPNAVGAAILDSPRSDAAVRRTRLDRYQQFYEAMQGAQGEPVLVLSHESHAGTPLHRMQVGKLAGSNFQFTAGIDSMVKVTVPIEPIPQARIIRFDQANAGSLKVVNIGAPILNGIALFRPDQYDYGQKEYRFSAPRRRVEVRSTTMAHVGRKAIAKAFPVMLGRFPTDLGVLLTATLNEMLTATRQKPLL